MATPQTVEILGVRVDRYSREKVLRSVSRLVEDGQLHYLVTINPEFITAAQSDNEFKNILVISACKQ